MMENESAWRPENKTREGLLHLWSVMEEVVNNGINNEGILPGGLKVHRRSHKLHQQLIKKSNKKIDWKFNKKIDRNKDLPSCHLFWFVIR